MRLYTLNEDYIEYLKQFDDKVPNVKYKDKFKLFLGKVRVTNDVSNTINFYIPLTSYKPKFESMNNRLDFIKILDPIDDQIIGAIDINNMIPAPDVATEVFVYDTLRNNPNFKTFRNKEMYFKHLAMNELHYLNSIQDHIVNNAKTLFSMYRAKGDKFDVLKQRCCNFTKLLGKATDFEDIIQNEVKGLMEDISGKLIESESKDYRNLNKTKGKEL